MLELMNALRISKDEGNGDVINDGGNVRVV